MTTEELESRVRVSKIGSGTFRFETVLHGRQIYMVSNDSITYDIINSRESMLGTTYKHALQYAHDCVVKANKQYHIYRK